MKYIVPSLIISLLLSVSANAQKNINNGQTEKKIAIREIRKTTVAGSAGWNGLSGFGLTAGLFITKNYEFEIGAGLSFTGLKVGGRFNYVFIDNKLSPIVSGGFMHGFGYGDRINIFKDDNSVFHYTIDDSPYVQLALGVEYISDRGIMIKALSGYAILTKNKNFNITSGSPSEEQLKRLNTILGSGIVLEISIGYAY